MKDNKSRIIILICIILLTALIVFLAFKLNDIRKNEENIEETNTNNIIENKLENNIINEENKEENSIKNNTNIVIENNNTQNANTNKNEDEVDKETIEQEENNKEKAVNIAKNNWGEDDSVYFTFDSINNEGKYLVCVRDKATTQALYWYIVDIESGTFEIE